LTSRYNKNLIITVTQTVLEQYPEGDPIALANYSLVKDENGNIYLLVDDAMRPIESMDAFRRVGFSLDELIDITAREVSAYDVGTPITTSTQDPTGRVVKLTTNGALFYLKDGIRRAVLDPAVMNANFPGTIPENAKPVDIEQYREGSFLKLPDGTLVRSFEHPAVYVIADGEKHAIESEQIFNDYGYMWSNILFVSDDVLVLHKTGTVLGAETE
jgi:hypothetical protein